MNKSFLILLVLVVFLGAGFGGSFVGGVIYGQSIEDESENSLSPRLGSSQLSGGSAAASQEETPDTATGATRATGTNEGSGPPVAERQPRQGRDAQGGAADSAESVEERGAGPVAPPAQTPSRPEGDASLEPSSPEGEPGQATPPGGPGRGGIVGTIEGLEGDLMTLTSPGGELTVNIAESTMVYEVKKATTEALTVGSRVRIAASRNEEGEIAAQSLVIVPEGVDNLFGSAGGPGGRRRGQ